MRTVQNELDDGPGKFIQLILPRVHGIKADNPSFREMQRIAAIIEDTRFTNLPLNHRVDRNAIRFHSGIRAPGCLTEWQAQRGLSFNLILMPTSMLSEKLIV